VIRVLIVEDERPLLRALTVLADHQHDAIVLDLGSGVGVIRAVRTFAATPIIVLSARNGS
jgi:DNA-binding response OmpR family regulator